MQRVSTLVGGCMLVLSAACMQGDGSVDRNTLIDSRDAYDPRTLDPARATDVSSGRAVSYLFDGLTRFAPDASLEPGLAEHWEVSEDGRVYTFHLRQGVRFHDGTPFTSRNVTQSFRRLLQVGDTRWPLYPIRGARAFAEANGAETDLGIETPDDSTVIITLEQPLPIFLKLLAMPPASIVPESVGENFSENPVGTGPWKFVEWRHDDYLKFARNDEYFGGAPQLDTLHARIIPEPSTAVAEFEAGAVDLLYVPEDQTRTWQDTDERKALLITVPALRLWYIGINVNRGPLTDVRVRQAIAHALDVPTILQQLLTGRGTVAAGVIPPSLEGYDKSRQPFPYDTLAARRLLAEAGHPNGIELELWVSQTPPFPRVAQTIQAYLASAGIRVQITQREAPAVRAAARAGQTDLILKDWYADYPDAENFLYPLLHSDNSGAGGNVSFFADADFDRVVSAARVEMNTERRNELYRQADSIGYAKVGLLPLFFYNDLYAVQPWISGFKGPVVFNGQRMTDVEIRR